MYEEKEFRSIADDDLGLETEEDKEKTKKADEDNKGIFDFMTETLSGKVVAVRASSRLKSHPVCLSAEGGISIEMEKVLASQPNEENRVKANKVLEVNTEHPIFEKMKVLFEEDQEKLRVYSELLWNQACLIEGLEIDDPVGFANTICTLM